MVEKLYVIAVAPHTGAWIETALQVLFQGDLSVAPHTGAWIETTSFPETSASIWSLPIRERGLKPPVFIKIRNLYFVAPHTGAWIETR